MTAYQRTWAWGIAFAIFFGLIYLLGDVLTPFIIGAAVAYLLDPACDKLESIGCSRIIATCIITATFFIIAAAVLVLVAPLLVTQILNLAHNIPEYTIALQEKSVYVLGLLEKHLSPEEVDKLRDTFGSASSDIVKFILGLGNGLMSIGGSLMTLVSTALITPIVTFYLLRDWDIIIAKIDSWLPRATVGVIRKQIKLVDETLSGFARGQATVCFTLGIFYGSGLFLAGLDFGFIVGFITGLISFVPYFGMLVGITVGTAIAIAQFGEVTPVLIVVGIFIAGQILEGNILTPKLVGDRVGLHAVWIIFALMAGGAMFGFVGILVAVPLMAIIGVLVRFSLDQYLQGPLYKLSKKKR